MNKPVFVFGKKVIEYLVRVGGGVQMHKISNAIPFSFRFTSKKRQNAA